LIDILLNAPAWDRELLGMKVVACIAIFSVVTWLLATLSQKLLHLRGPAICQHSWVVLFALPLKWVCSVCLRRIRMTPTI
jgi:uncharacterized membrane protein